MSDALLLLSPGPYKLDLQPNQLDSPSSTVGMSGAMVDVALLTVGTGPSQNALSVPGVVSRSLGDQLDIIQSANASSQLAAGQPWGTAKLTEDSSEFGNVTRGNTFDVAPGTAVSAVLPSGQNSVASFPSDTAISQPRMRLLSEETALRVAPRTQNDVTIVTDSRPNSLLRSVIGSSAVVDQLKDIIVSTQGRPYQTSDDAWIQGQLNSIDRGQTSLQQVRQSLAQWSAQHGEYDSAYTDIHGRAPTSTDRQYAATMIGSGWSLQDYRWHEAHGDVAARDYNAMFVGVTGYQPSPGDMQWIQNAAAGGQSFITLRNNLAWSDHGRNAIAKSYNEIHGQVALKYDLDYGCQKLASGMSLSEYRRAEAYSDLTTGQYRTMFAGITGYQPSPGDMQWLQNAAAGGQSFITLRNNLAWSDHGRNAIAKSYNEIHGQVALKYDLDYGCQKLASGMSLSQYSREEAFSELTAGQYRTMFAGVTGYQPENKTVQWLQNAAAGGQSFVTLRNNLAWSDFGRNTILHAYHDIGNLIPYETAVEAWQKRLGNGEIYAALRAGIASVHAGSALNDLAHSVLSRSFTSEEMSAYKAQLVDGKSLDDIEAFIRRSIFSDPSLYGPNLAINTQGVINGQVQYNGNPSSLNGDTSPDWGVIQWRGQSALDPAAGTSSQVWDKNFGNSVGHWTQGSATSSAGKTEYNVFRDPKDGHYVYQMAAQGGNLLDVQLATLGSVDHRYSFDHQITASLDQGISDYKGYTGVYQAGVNFTINYHSDNLNFGIFLQFESVDYTGVPGTYVAISPSLSGSIFNVSGTQAAYINPLLKQNDGVMYHTEIDVNQGLMGAIRAIGGLFPKYATELQNLSNWYLDGMYIGVETIGSGQASDVTGKYNVKDPIVTYNQDKKVSYADKSKDAAIVTMTPIPKA